MERREVDDTVEIPVVEDEILGAADQTALDFSDLEKVIFNVETRDGRQYSLIMAREEGTTLSLQTDHEGEYQQIENGAGQILQTVFIGRQAWEFVVIREPDDALPD